MIKNYKRLFVFILSFALLVVSVIGSTSFSKAEDQESIKETHKNEAYYVTSKESNVKYDSYNYITKSGALANLVEKDYLYFNNLIDLTEFSKNETFIEIAPVSAKRGKCDYFQITLDIIDAYDSSNYITIKMRPYPGIEEEGNVIFLNTFASNGQQPTSKDRIEDLIRTNSQYGLWVYGSMSCIEGVESVATEKNYIGLTFDYEENKIYCKEQYTNSLFLLADFDDPEFFGNSIWDGFKDGKVYARVKCADYQTSEALLMVRKYGNYDLSNNVLIDDLAPVITIDNMGYSLDNLPKALVGQKYPILNATSYDVHEGNKKTDINVYLNYYSSQKIKINAKGNAFVPQLPSICYIEYSSTDSKGNTNKQVLEVEAVSLLEPLNISFDNFKEQAEIGALYKLPKYTLTGGTGKLDTKVKVTLNGKELQISNNCIQPLETGKMLIEYKISDYIGEEKTITKEVTINNSTHLIFESEPILPKYLIKGNTYYLNELYAYDYISLNGEKVKSEIYIDEGQGNKQILNGEYIVGDTNKATIIYKATSSKVTETYRKEIEVIDIKSNNSLDMAKLFKISGSGIVTANFDSVSIKTSSDSSYEYINVLSGVNFNTEFKVNPSISKIEKISVILTDYENESSKIKLTYKFTNSGIYFYVNDDFNSKQKVNADINKLSSFLLVYKNSTNSVIFDATSNKNIIIKNDLSGNEFNGFNSGLCYACYSIENVTKESEVLIQNIGCQFLNDEYQDYISPVIDVVSSYGGEFVVNDVISLPDIISIDGISGKLKTYLKITDPNGEIVTSTEGVFLNNSLYLNNVQIKLEKYGLYNVQFSSKDSMNNSINLSYGIRVVDIIKPEIILNGEIDEKCKVGDLISLPTTTIKDNYSKTLTLKILVYTPSGQKIDISKNYNGFTASEKGNYKLVYMLIDENGNYQTIVHTIKAE